ncbi:DUF6525 family protein, partial [Paracoccus siganidrum]|uniref:DUF6525 family protein n=1 Tax=Paracoccus siganidrum TaxID=1276757 RepID=UPI001F0C8085
MRRNLVTSLRRRRRPCPIEEYDRLPPELRNWLAQAALPWSPHSALRLWRKYLRESAGNTSAAQDRRLSGPHLSGRHDLAASVGQPELRPRPA